MKRFITFEGIDGSGKSTIAHNVYTRLSEQGYAVVLTAEPTQSQIGAFAKHCITTNADPFVTSFACIADRINHCKKIQQWLDQQKIVLCDRYAESTYAYQGVQLSEHLKNPITWLRNLSETRILTADQTFYLRINPDQALQRIRKRKQLISFEEKHFLEKVHANYEKICRGKRFVICDASDPIEVITERCIRDILK